MAADAGSALHVLVLDDREGLLAAAPAMAELRAAADSVRVLPEGDGAATLAALADTVRARITVLMAVRERTRLDRATLGLLPSLRVILQTGGHAYHIDQEATRERGIAVLLGRRVQGPLHAIPELVFGMAIAAMRHITAMHKPPQRPSSQPSQWPQLPGRVLHGRRLGLLGCGRHGRNVARIARAFGMDVVAWDRTGGAATGGDGCGLRGSEAAAHAANRSAAEAGAGVEAEAEEPPRLPLGELLGTSDVVSVHLRLSEESRGLLNAERLAQVKPGCVLINTARGAIVCEADLVRALQDPAHPLAAAGLDVYEQEPLPEDSPLRTLDNVVLTPHIGWTTEEVFAEFVQLAAGQLQDIRATGFAALQDHRDCLKLSGP